MVEIRIKDLPVGAFTSGQKIPTDSDANGTRQIDVDAVTSGVLGEVHNQGVGTFTSGEKMLTDSAANGPRQIDTDVVIQGVLGDIRNQVVGAFTAGEKLVTDSAGNGTRQIDVQDIIDAYDAAIAAALATSINTVDSGLLEAPGGNARLGGLLLQDTAIGQLADPFTFSVVASLVALTADAIGGLNLNSNAGPLVLTASLDLSLGSLQDIIANATGTLDLNAADVDIDSVAATNITAGSDLDLVATTGDALLNAPAGDASLVGNLVKVITAAGAGSVGDVFTNQGPGGRGEWTSLSYGEQFEGGGSPGTAFLVVTAGTPVKWNPVTLGELAGAPLMTWAAGTFTVGADGGGLYRMTGQWSFNGDPEIFVGIPRLNGGDVTKAIWEREINASRLGSASVTCLLRLAPTDTVDFWFDCRVNNKTLQLFWGNLNLHRVSL